MVTAIKRTKKPTRTLEALAYKWDETYRSDLQIEIGVALRNRAWEEEFLRIKPLTSVNEGDPVEDYFFPVYYINSPPPIGYIFPFRKIAISEGHPFSDSIKDVLSKRGYKVLENADHRGLFNIGFLVDDVRKGEFSSSYYRVI